MNLNEHIYKKEKRNNIYKEYNNRKIELDIVNEMAKNNPGKKEYLEAYAEQIRKKIKSLEKELEESVDETKDDIKSEEILTKIKHAIATVKEQQEKFEEEEKKHKR